MSTRQRNHVRCQCPKLSKSNKSRSRRKTGIVLLLVLLLASVGRILLFDTSGRSGFFLLSSYGGHSIHKEEKVTILDTTSIIILDEESATAAEDVVDAIMIANTTTIDEGVLSKKPFSFFRKIRDEIDHKIPCQVRCRKYEKSFLPPPGQQASPCTNRRIFFGSLVADESWELFEIMGAEVYQILEGIVFVESNRTQSYTVRPFRHVNNEATVRRLQRIYGTNNVLIRQFVNETKGKLHGLTRENVQRQEILKAWKEMGMQPEDVGYISDVDESFSRDFLLAIKTCPYVAALDYNRHKCHPGRGSRIQGMANVYEGTPNCLTKDRTWAHPDIVIGACVEHIGNATEHPWAPRNRHKRNIGFASGSEHRDVTSVEYQRHYANITGEHYPLWSAGDFRMQKSDGFSVPQSSFHLHNWFANFDTVRNKYKTYGHPVKRAMIRPIYDIHDDLKLLVYCLKNYTDSPTKREQKDSPSAGDEWTEVQNYQRIITGEAGFEGFPDPLPIYFRDEEYRSRKHEITKARLREDINKRFARLQPTQQAQEVLDENLREMKRQEWARYKNRINN